MRYSASLFEDLRFRRVQISAVLKELWSAPATRFLDTGTAFVRYKCGARSIQENSNPLVHSDFNEMRFWLWLFQGIGEGVWFVAGVPKVGNVQRVTLCVVDYLAVLVNDDAAIGFGAIIQKILFLPHIGILCKGIYLPTFVCFR